jgi:hypothetical protein
MQAGLIALHWIIEGYGYEITGQDVRDAWTHTAAAAEKAGSVEGARARLGELVAGDSKSQRFVRDALKTEFRPT